MLNKQDFMLGVFFIFFKFVFQYVFQFVFQSNKHTIYMLFKFFMFAGNTVFYSERYSCRHL
jgi:hypothetical protein